MLIHCHFGWTRTCASSPLVGTSGAFDSHDVDGVKSYTIVAGQIVQVVLAAKSHGPYEAPSVFAPVVMSPVF